MVLASLVVYLVQGWTNWDYLGRLLGLCSITSMLLLGGHIYNYVTKDRKAAYTLFFLGLLSSAAHFSYLGDLFDSINAITSSFGLQKATYLFHPVNTFLPVFIFSY